MRQLVLTLQIDQRPSELGWVTALLPVLRRPELLLLHPALAIVLNGQVGIPRRFLGEQLRAKEARVDNHGLDAERPDLDLQRLHPAIKAELRGGVGSTELVAD